MPQTTITNALLKNLQLLTLNRTLVAIGQAIALFYFSVINDIGLQLTPLISVLVLMSIFSIATWLRLSSRREVSELEFFIHLCVDMLALALMLYYSGGASNPFVSYFLVPVAIGSSILRWNYSAALALLGLAAYSFLLFYYVPVHAFMSHGMTDGLSLHLVGMWLNFVVSALLIAFFIVRMAQRLNLQRQQLAEQREQQMENDRLVSVATLAANTAHQLGTPINSISLLAAELNELSLDDSNQPVVRDLQNQVKRCKTILQNLVSTADFALQEGDQQVQVNSYFSDLLERWSVLHPEQTIDIDQDTLQQQKQIILAPKSLEPAIFNLLNNATQSGGDIIRIEFDSDDRHATLHLFDNGTGMPDSVLERLGEPFNSTKPDGMGIGLYLAITTAQAMGGELTFNSTELGTEAKLQLPIIEKSR